MSKMITLPTLSEEEAQLPVVMALMVIIEKFAVMTQGLEEKVQQLSDEILILKGEKKRPKFKSSKMDENTEGSSDDTDEGGDTKKRRPGSDKKAKTKNLVIHEEITVKPSDSIPFGSRFKGYRDFVVQELVIQTHNVRYRLERWETPDGQVLMGKLPESIGNSHFGPTLNSYILYQHHHCQVTQPLLLEQLREWGVDISLGGINEILLSDKEDYHIEKDALLTTGLEVSSYVTVDDTGARHEGKNAYVTHIGNEFFAWFCGTESKSRVNFLELLRANHKDLQINMKSLEYMTQHKLPKIPLELLQSSEKRCFSTNSEWEEHLTTLGIEKARHRRIATEGALLGAILDHGLSPELAIISDDAGQFNILLHGLCWIHAERLVHKLIPLNDEHREDIASTRDQIWELYADLKEYKKNPSVQFKADLQSRFDKMFTKRTRFETLNGVLKRLHRNKEELLLVLDRPDVPLHTNGSECDIRDYVKKNKVSGGTRSHTGRRCRDTFASLKKTCRKLGVSFWEYLTDRESKSAQIPLLSNLVKLKATPS